EMRNRIERCARERPHAPCRAHQCGQQHEKAVGDRPADESRNHGLAPGAFLSGGTMRPFALLSTAAPLPCIGAIDAISNAPSPRCRMSKLTVSPTAMPEGNPAAGSLKPIVIAP